MQAQDWKRLIPYLRKFRAEWGSIPLTPTISYNYKWKSFLFYGFVSELLYRDARGRQMLLHASNFTVSMQDGIYIAEKYAYRFQYTIFAQQLLRIMDGRSILEEDFRRTSELYRRI